MRRSYVSFIYLIISAFSIIFVFGSLNPAGAQLTPQDLIEIGGSIEDIVRILDVEEGPDDPNEAIWMPKIQLNILPAPPITYYSPEPPPAAEVCDGEDNDGDGQVDEDLSRPCSTACGTGTETCRNGQWASCSASQPQAEACDGEDNDCDGQVDEGVKNTYYADNDGDGYGDPAKSIQACSAPGGYVTDHTDYNDTDRNIHTESDLQITQGALIIEGTRGQIGEEVQITVKIQDAHRTLSSLGFSVSYDASVLEYTGYDKGEIVDSFQVFNANAVSDASGSEVIIGGFGVGPASIAEGSSGTLVLLKFRVKDGLENECYPLGFIIDDLDSNLGDFSLNGGDFCINAAMCTGDLNEDGTITPADALLVFQCYLRTIPCPVCADVNRDLTVTPSDALCLFQRYMGQPSCLDNVYYGK